MTKQFIDLNADVGEGGKEDADLLSQVSSANIACGLHAGGPSLALETIRVAFASGVSIGAHPGFADRENFGRKEVATSAAEAEALIAYQLGAFHSLCRLAGVPMRHVKLHGALYNMAARDRELARATAESLARCDSSLILFAPARSELARAGRGAGLRVAEEVFADRHYCADGTLVPRSRTGALVSDPAEAAQRVVRMVREGVVRSIDGDDIAVSAETVCIHGDGPEAAQFARAVRQKLAEAGIAVAPPRF